jgi:hypothetical protein
VGAARRGVAWRSAAAATGGERAPRRRKGCAPATRDPRRVRSQRVHSFNYLRAYRCDRERNYTVSGPKCSRRAAKSARGGQQPHRRPRGRASAAETPHPRDRSKQERGSRTRLLSLLAGRLRARPIPDRPLASEAATSHGAIGTFAACRCPFRGRPRRGGGRIAATRCRRLTERRAQRLGSAGMLISRLRTLPVEPLGSSSQNHTWRGYL